MLEACPSPTGSAPSGSAWAVSAEAPYIMRGNLSVSKPAWSSPSSRGSTGSAASVVRIEDDVPRFKPTRLPFADHVFRKS